MFLQGFFSYASVTKVTANSPAWDLISSVTYPDETKNQGTKKKILSDALQPEVSTFPFYALMLSNLLWQVVLLW